MEANIILPWGGGESRKSGHECRRSGVGRGEERAGRAGYFVHGAKEMTKAQWPTKSQWSNDQGMQTTTDVTNQLRPSLDIGVWCFVGH